MHLHIYNPKMAISVILEFARTDRADDPFAFRFAAQEYLLRSEGGSVASSIFPWQQSLLGKLEALRGPQRDPVLLQQVGDLLQQFLQPLGFAQHEQRILEAQRASERVVLTIRSAAAELYALPWELLTLRVTGQHLGELPDVLLRYEWPDSTSAPSACPPNQTGRFLLAWSAAAGPVPVVEHLSALQSACRQSGLPFDAEREVVAHVSCGRLIAALDSAQKSGAAVRVLHLLCHGGTVGSTFGLSLDADEVGAAGVVVDAGRLRQLLAPYASTLRLVVLCACESGNPGSLGNQLGSVAQTLHRAGIASVIASRYPLSVAGSIRFCQVLYEQLLLGPSSLEDALLVARRRLAEDASQLDWASLQLYARTQDGDDTRPVTFRPYRGLLAFQPEHHRFLFGRSPEVAEILSDLSALIQAGRPRLLIVAGVSGTGKSSLVLGGAVPRLLEQHGGALRLLRLRPGSQPLDVLNAALAGNPADSRAVLLIVDQFEEVFTHVQDPALRQAFARRLWTLASEPHSASQTTVLITLRVDFIGRCGELLLNDAGLCLDRIAYDEAHRIFISKPGPEQLRAVITEPARLVGLAIEPGLTSRILDDLGAEPGALPLLQDTLDLLWQRRQGRLLTQQAYDELGGVVGALRGHADALFDALTEAEQRMAKRLMVRLVELRHEEDLSTATRRRLTWRSLRPASPQDAIHQDALLARMVDARLLVTDQEGIEPTVEIAHEALIRSWTRLHSWLRADKLRLAALAEFELWVSRWRQYGTLLVSDELVHAEAVAQHCAEDLGIEASALLTASRRRRTRSSLAATFLLSIGAITLLSLLSLFIPRIRSDSGIIVIFMVIFVMPILAFIVIMSLVIRLLWKRVASARVRQRKRSIG